MTNAVNNQIGSSHTLVKRWGFTNVNGEKQETSSYHASSSNGNEKSSISHNENKITLSDSVNQVLVATVNEEIKKANAQKASDQKITELPFNSKANIQFDSNDKNDKQKGVITFRLVFDLGTGKEPVKINLGYVEQQSKKLFLNEKFENALAKTPAKELIKSYMRNSAFPQDAGADAKKQIAKMQKNIDSMFNGFMGRESELMNSLMKARTEQNPQAN